MPEYEQLKQGHLGGYVIGGDPATYYPDLWTWASRRYEARSVLDLGCGEGHSLRFFRDRLGCEVLGLEGIPQKDPDVRQIDFSTSYYSPDRTFDLLWCCEFLEHLEERHLPNIVPSIQSCRVALATHAFPGQDGHHHVNCRDPEYWRGFFAAIGFREDPDETSLTREQARRCPYPNPHYGRSGMVFRRS